MGGKAEQADHEQYAGDEKAESQTFPFGPAQNDPSGDENDDEVQEFHSTLR